MHMHSYLDWLSGETPKSFCSDNYVESLHHPEFGSPSSQQKLDTACFGTGPRILA